MINVTKILKFNNTLQLYIKHYIMDFQQHY